MTIVYQDLVCAEDKELDKTSEWELENVREKGMLGNKMQPQRLSWHIIGHKKCYSLMQERQTYLQKDKAKSIWLWSEDRNANVYTQTYCPLY